MLIRIPKSWQMPEREATPEAVYLNRRSFLEKAGLTAGAIAGSVAGASLAAPSLLAQAKPAAAPAASLYPAKQNAKFKLDRDLTPEFAATGYNNFYEFDPMNKEAVKNLVGRFQISPWTVEIKGLVNKPGKLDFDDLVRRFPLEERLYRFRCVERWAMAVPWTGFPLSLLVKAVEPKPNARYLRFLTVVRGADQMPGVNGGGYSFPYFEGLRLDEAMNELTLLATGLYGKPMPKQNGAPIRIVAPWKYGYKSIKSIVSIEFTEKEPPTFWNRLQPSEYGFYSNIDPNKPHPRWSQAVETMIPTGERRRTQLYNGYGEYVAGMYNGKEY